MAFALVNIELIFELYKTLNRFDDKWRKAGWRFVFLQNFIIISIFLPSIMTFYLMKVVSKRYI